MKYRVRKSCIGHKNRCDGHGPCTEGFCVCCRWVAAEFVSFTPLILVFKNTVPKQTRKPPQFFPLLGKPLYRTRSKTSDS